MFPLIFLFLLLQLPLHLSSFSNQDCFPDFKHSIYKDGDVVIAGFFPLYSYVKDDRHNDPSMKGVSAK
jgi:hypothetical protein